MDKQLQEMLDKNLIDVEEAVRRINYTYIYGVSTDVYDQLIGNKITLREALEKINKIKVDTICQSDKINNN